MKKYAKLVNGIIEFAPLNKGNIINFLYNENLLKKEGYKEYLEEEEKPLYDNYLQKLKEEYLEENDKIKKIYRICDLSQEEIKEKRMKLFLTKADVERALYKAKGMDFDDILDFLENNKAQDLDIKALKIELGANYFYRENPYIDKIGNLLGFNSEELDNLFKNGSLI